jgi:hypothetical protein
VSRGGQDEKGRCLPESPVNWEDHKGLVGLWATRVYPSFWQHNIELHELVEIGFYKLWQCFQPGKYDAAKSKPSTYALKALFRYTATAHAIAAGFNTEARQKQAWTNERMSIDAAVFGRTLNRLHDIMGEDDPEPKFIIREHLMFLLDLARPSEEERAVFMGIMEGHGTAAIGLRFGRSRSWAAAKLSDVIKRIQRIKQMIDDNPGMTPEDVYLIRELARQTAEGYNMQNAQGVLMDSETPQYKLSPTGMPIRISDGEVFPARTVVAELNRLASLATMATNAEAILTDRAQAAEAETARLRAENANLDERLTGNDQEVRRLQKRIHDMSKASGGKKADDNDRAS